MKRRAPLLDMTPDGQFRAAPQPTLTARIVVGGVIVGMLAAGVAAAALAFWLALALVPVAAASLVVAYIAFRVQLWRSRRPEPAVVVTTRR